MFIDVHAHAYRKVPFYGPKGNRKWVTPETLLEFYDKHQIEAGCLMPLLGPEFYPPQPNEDILEAAERRHRDREQMRAAEIKRQAEGLQKPQRKR